MSLAGGPFSEGGAPLAIAFLEAFTASWAEKLDQQLADAAALMAAMTAEAPEPPALDPSVMGQVASEEDMLLSLEHETRKRLQVADPAQAQALYEAVMAEAHPDFGHATEAQLGVLRKVASEFVQPQGEPAAEFAGEASATALINKLKAGQPLLPTEPAATVETTEAATPASASGGSEGAGTQTSEVATNENVQEQSS
jgi:hypothetical protein